MAITASQAQGLVLALFGASAGAHLTGLTSAASVSAEAADLVTAAGLVLDQDLSNNTTFRDLVLVTNLKLTGAALTAAQAWMDGEFTKGTARGDIIAAAVTFLDGLTDTTNTFYATAAAYRATVAAAVTWSQGAGATVTSVATLMAQQGTVSNAQGQTFTLTTGTDTLVGTTGNDTFTGAATTYAAADQVIDSSTTDNDTYNLTVTSSNLSADNSLDTVADDADALSEIAPKTVNVEHVNVTLSATTGADVFASQISGAKDLTVTRTNVTVGGSSIVGDKTVTVEEVNATKVAKVIAGAGTTDMTVSQSSATAGYTGVTVDASAATGDVTVTGPATVTAGSGSSKTVSVQGTGTASEDTGAVVVNAATAGTVNVGNTTATTGTVTINAAAAKVVSASVAGGGSISALGGTTGVTLTAITDKGVDLTTSYVGTKTAASDKSGLISLTGNGSGTDTATVHASGEVGLTLTTLTNVTLSGNGAAAVYTVGTSATKTTLTGTQDVTVVDSAANLTGKTLVDSTTAGVTTVRFDGAVAAASSFTKLAPDQFVVAADLTTTAVNTVKFSTGANVILAKDQATRLDFVGNTAKSTLNLSTADDTNADGSVIEIAVGALAADSLITTVNVDATVGKFTATGTTLDAAATLNITGTKAVSLGTVAAKAVTAGTSTGDITLTSSTTKAITTGSGVDTITTTGTVVYTIDAGNGDNVLSVNAAAAAGSSFATGDGADSVTLAAGAVNAYVIATGAGNDSVTINGANDSIIVLGDGTDTLTVGAATNVSNTTTYANFAISGVETVALGANTLTLAPTQFAGDNAFALTGSGTLAVVGGTTAATIDASNVTRANSVTASVTLQGSSKADTITGTAGADTIYATAGADTISGGTGTDTFSYANVTLGVLEGTGTGTQTGAVINLGATAVTATAVLGKVSSYTADANTSIAASTAGWLYAASGSTNSATVQTLSSIENVVGTSGADYIVGSAQNNVLNGAGGNDYILGGAGSDTFVFSSALAADADTYGDFATGVDKVQLSKAIFTALAGTAGDQTLGADFYSSAAAVTAGTSTRAEAIVYDQTTGKIYYNADGATAGGLTLVGTVTAGASTIATTDFSIVA